MPRRPKKDVDLVHVEYLLSIGFTWEAIASLQGCSTKTIRRRAKDVGLEKYDSFTDSSLDTIVQDILSRFPTCGEVMLRGHLRNQQVTAELVECASVCDEVTSSSYTTTITCKTSGIFTTIITPLPVPSVGESCN